MKAADLNRRAREWRKHNPKAWEYIEKRALEEAEAKRPFTVQSLIEEARGFDFTPTNKERFKINNSYEPVFARMLLAEHPHLGRSMKIRKSRMDEFF